MSIKNLQELQDAIYQWSLAQLPGVPVYWADHNISKPANDHFTFRLNNFMRVGQHSLGTPDSDGIAVISGNVEFMLQVQGYGLVNANPSIVEQGTALRDTLYRHSVQQTLRANDIVFVNDITGIVDISGTDESQFERRFSLDILFRVGLSPDFTDDVGVIQKVQAQGTLTAGDNEHGIDIEVQNPAVGCSLGSKFFFNDFNGQLGDNPDEIAIGGEIVFDNGVLTTLVQPNPQEYGMTLVVNNLIAGQTQVLEFDLILSGDWSNRTEQIIDPQLSSEQVSIRGDLGSGLLHIDIDDLIGPVSVATAIDVSSPLATRTKVFQFRMVFTYNDGTRQDYELFLDGVSVLSGRQFVHFPMSNIRVLPLRDIVEEHAFDNLFMYGDNFVTGQDCTG